jgi:hypothetical protein
MLCVVSHGRCKKQYAISVQDAFSVKYIVVCIDEANKMEGCTFLELFLPDFAFLLNEFDAIQHELPAITFKYVLSSCDDKISWIITLS